MAKMKDLTGQRFGRLTAIAPAGRIGTSCMRWVCKCDCGNETVVYGHFLKSGHTKSCGCLANESIAQRNKTHGMTESRLYNIWHGIKARCYRPQSNQFYRYGARGISMCPEWRDDFSTFAEWALSNGYSDNLSIDRIDNDGIYCPSNCRWVDVKTQCNNKSTNRLLTANGETHTVSEWSAILGINDSTLCARLDRGWSEEKTINTPLKIYRRHKT